MKINPAEFKKVVWRYYRSHKRDMPWRRDHSAYAIVVSEIMLQQTQVGRVTAKFPSFIARFSSFKALAKAPLHDVLHEWSGLGYNRRALYLKRIAEEVTGLGGLPRTYDELRKLPGIGPNTAGSILAFAFDVAHPFIETNIRSAYIHFFFGQSRKKVSDAEIMPLIEKTLDMKRPREWHWALMDYGSYLKAAFPNPSRKSAHHVRQKPFKGSNREARAKLLRSVMEAPLEASGLDAQSSKNLLALAREGFIEKKAGKYVIV